MNSKNPEIKNRWVCTTPSEVRVFKETMFLISMTTLLALILLYFFRWVFRGLLEYFYTELLIIVSRNSSALAGMASRMFTEEIMMMTENIVSMLISIFTFVLACLFLAFTMTGKNRYIDTGVSLKPKFPGNMLILIIVGLGIVNFFSYTSSMFDMTLTNFGIFKREGIIYRFPQTTAGVVIYFLSIVAVPSWFEEFMFRYLILNSLRRYGNAFAIIVSSVLFGFLHASTSAFFFATALGMFSAYIAIKTKSLCFSVILHAIVNSVSMFFEYLNGVLSESTVDMIYFIYFESVLFISAAAVFAFIAKNGKIQLTEHKNYIYIEKHTKIAGFWNATSIIFFVAVVFISMTEYYLSYGSIDLF